MPDITSKIDLKNAISDSKDTLSPREKFLKIYADVPLAFRNQIIAVLEGEPISWNVAYIEIKGDTKKGTELLKKLREFRIL
jgi:hypothetical protein